MRGGEPYLVVGQDGRAESGAERPAGGIPGKGSGARDPPAVDADAGPIGGDVVARGGRDDLHDGCEAAGASEAAQEVAAREGEIGGGAGRGAGEREIADRGRGVQLAVQPGREAFGQIDVEPGDAGGGDRRDDREKRPGGDAERRAGALQGARSGGGPASGRPRSRQSLCAGAGTRERAAKAGSRK